MEEGKVNLDYLVYKTMREYAKRLVIRGYVTAHGGNLSIRSGNTVWITRHASSLEDLKQDDVIKIRMDKPVGFDIVASTETPVHLAVYRKSSNLAVIHAHPKYAIALSYFYDELVPMDSEAYHVMKKIPVVEGSPGSQMLAENVSDALSKYHAVIVRGHGVFASAKFMDVAYQYLVMVEHAAEVIYLVEFYKQTGKKFITPKIF